jgi:hypothetical protein
VTDIIDITAVVENNVVVTTTVEDPQPITTVDSQPNIPGVIVDPSVVATVEQKTLDVQTAVGIPGPPGPAGPIGPEGAGLQIDASGNTAGRSVYDSEAEGFVYLDTQTGLLYRRETATPGVWSVGVDFGGADGNTILYGIVDPTTEGVDGDFYINTASNEIFGPKAGGSWPAGVSLIGPTGADGNTILYGAVDPTTEGVDGDFYINTATSFIFGPKAGGTWPAGTTLGGADGNTILYGAVDPTTEGVDGDFYINTATSFIFGPKAGGSWPAGTSLIGPQGDPGVAGPAGLSYTGPEIYVQASEPVGVPDGTIWISTT